MEEKLANFIQVSTTNQKNTKASIKNLELQIGQLAKQMVEQQDSQFSANTKVNSKEHCYSITTRKRTVIGKGIGKNLEKRETKKMKEKIVSEKMKNKKNWEQKKRENSCSESTISSYSNKEGS